MTKNNRDYYKFLGKNENYEKMPRVIHVILLYAKHFELYQKLICKVLTPIRLFGTSQCS